MTEDVLLRFRPEFPILANSTYLISNSLGAMPRGAADRLREYAETWATRGVRAWAESWWDMSVTVGDGVAPLIGAPAGTVTMLPPMRWRDDAFRFLLGTPPIPALYAATEGPRIVREAGVEAIRAKSLRQTARLIELGRKRDFRCAAPADPDRRGGTVAVDLDHALEVSRELNARDVVVDYRPGVGIRLSPHFYTTDEELDRAFDAIDEILASRAWERWSNRPTVVT